MIVAANDPVPLDLYLFTYLFIIGNLHDFLKNKIFCLDFRIRLQLNYLYLYIYCLVYNNNCRIENKLCHIEDYLSNFCQQNVEPKFHCLKHQNDWQVIRPNKILNEDVVFLNRIDMHQLPSKYLSFVKSKFFIIYIFCIYIFNHI